MNLQFAKEYMIERMENLGYKKGDYYIKYKHLVMQSGELKEIDGSNQFYMLTEEVQDVSIMSEMGSFDLSDNNLNEQRYEHQGTILIFNYSPHTTHLRLLQIIPKNS